MMPPNPAPDASPGWITVQDRRRARRQRRKGGDAAVAATASEGEDHSDGGSSTRSLTLSSDDTWLLSNSLPSPTSKHGLLAQLSAEHAGGDVGGSPSRPFQSMPDTTAANGSSSKVASGAGSAAGGFQQGRQAGQAPTSALRQLLQHEPTSPGQHQQQQAPVPPLTTGMLVRQDSQSQSALSLADLAKGAGLRSSKSEVATLSVHTARSAARQQRRSAQDGEPDSPVASAPRELFGESAGAPAPASAGRASMPPVAAASRRVAPEPSAPAGAAGAGPAAQPFAAYLAAELHPGPSYPTADVAWGQTERDRVYNALVAVPYQLERFMLFGVAICLDSFLAIFTLLPLRVGVALLALGRSLCGSDDGDPVSEGAPAAVDTPDAAASTARRAAREGGPAAGKGKRRGHGQHRGQQQSQPQQQQPQPAKRTRRRVQLRGDQLFDLLCAAMSLGVVVFLWNLNAGTLYFWMKDLTQELLKLSVLYTALELSDKICCSFGVDVLEALAASCTQLAAGWSRRAAAALCSDVLVASVLLALHGATLMSQAMVFGVAMNSKKNTLVALLIAANFTEIKGTVLKRFDANKLFALAAQDVVERFHLLLILAFVLVEEVSNSGARVPNPQLLAGCLHIYAGEVVIDIIKHAVLGKFNEIRPGVYREFFRDLAQSVQSAQSHNIHKLVSFEPFAPAALAFRIVATAAALRHAGGSDAGGGGGLASRPLALAGLAAAVLAAWLLLLGLKLCLGYFLKLVAAAYLRHYDARRGARYQRRATLQVVPPVAAKGKEE